MLLCQRHSLNFSAMFHVIENCFFCRPRLPHCRRLAFFAAASCLHAGVWFSTNAVLSSQTLALSLIKTVTAKANAKKLHFPTAALKINDFSHYPHPKGWDTLPVRAYYTT